MVKGEKEIEDCIEIGQTGCEKNVHKQKSSYVFDACDDNGVSVFTEWMHVLCPIRTERQKSDRRQ